MKVETNNPDLKFSSLEAEEWRIYEFRDGAKITILKPLRLNVSKSGGHRILDAEGVSHYIPSGWIHLYWRTKDNETAFQF